LKAGEIMEEDNGKRAQRKLHHQAECDRKITYHVGWRSGSIGRKHRTIGSVMIGLLLREAPLPTLGAFAYIVAGATAAAFLALCYLMQSLLNY
jgi:hypothetical protein